MNLQELLIAIKSNDAITKTIIESVIRNGIQSGALPSKVDDIEEFIKLSREYIEGIKHETVMLTIDHRERLLAEAKRYKRIGNYEYACIFYATWVEHWVNNIIVKRLIRSKFPKNQIYEVVQSYNFKEKLVWMPFFLGLKPIKEEYTKVLLKLADIRNSYIHYKWKPIEIESSQYWKELKSVMQDITKIIVYLKKYETSTITSRVAAQQRHAADRPRRKSPSISRK